ncbi:2-keto-4-pentenoate hydratase/2-oxohepta-3-ene-1,7-dioic acid hydratase (catechol pathway) [Desulfurella multipotens]|uniref:2-keto-4-pentenoate hydratase/2-oxohepta-3-ene-1,7-dioic acid hydratase (Catechol pathway) n=1 Tax=Desulfurella multipotens TaxID=79269 RepID=A0A1G6QZY2_9BACT|nr:fumarylacetoacetate hydrolase family protein [Desulfurella multipotens]SDC97970.1 2-keto-4-pentenoate hydratase/2-oxohepta-3-ene-1,7-dioic acid hydratase (catechol pathway) [Desulfurella multipotens]
MKFLRCYHENKEYYGLLENESVKCLSNNFLYNNFEVIKKANINDIKILPPVLPSKIIGIGLNYNDHIQEMKDEKPSVPKMFIKPSSTVIGPNEPIIYPKHMSKRVDYEGELGVVIGRVCKNVSVDQAKDYIFGYTIINDVTARDLQSIDGQWTRAKGFDTFAPIGPFIETEVDPMNLKITTKVNGQIRQNSTTSHMIFNVYELVSFISQIMTLYPGDLIASGTPSGVGGVEVGDVIEIEIEKIGKLINPVKE